MKKLSALVASCVVFAGAAHAEMVGNVGAVNQSARGTPPGASARSLSLGLGVHKRERIETSGDGSAQITFNDTSTITIGRSSAVTIDDFVYSGGSGSQGVSMAKGVMRFVGGGVSHESGARLRTPTASIGVRGGTAMVETGGSCGTLVVHQFGVISVANSVNSQNLTRSGYGVCAPHGGPVSEPFLVPPATIARIVAKMASNNHQQGGAQDPPTNYEAHLRLGQIRPPNVMDPPGLEQLYPFWAGNAQVFNRTVVDNQPGPMPTPAPDPETRYLDTYDGANNSYDP